MAFGFSDIGSMFSKGMGQYGQGLDKMRDLPMGQKMMAAGQILHGGVGPADMAGAAYRLGQPPGQGGVPGQPPMLPPNSPPSAAPAPAPAAPAAAPGGTDSSSLFMGLLPLLMKNGMGTGLLNGSGMGLLGDSGGGLGGLLGKFGFGG